MTIILSFSSMPLAMAVGLLIAVGAALRAGAAPGRSSPATSS